MIDIDLIYDIKKDIEFILETEQISVLELAKKVKISKTTLS